jgi:hypothetical protein
MPIPIKEIPPSDLFFSKKRKAVVKKEMHQKEGATVKKNRVLLDGQNLEEEDFSTEVARYLGDFSTTNLFLVDNLKKKTEKESGDKSVEKSNKDYKKECQR